MGGQRRTDRYYKVYASIRRDNVLEGIYRTLSQIQTVNPEPANVNRLPNIYADISLAHRMVIDRHPCPRLPPAYNRCSGREPDS